MVIAVCPPPLNPLLPKSEMLGFKDKKNTGFKNFSEIIKWCHIVYVSEYKNMFLHELYMVLTTEIQGTQDIHRLSVTEGRPLLYSNSVAVSGANGVLEHSLAWLLSKNRLASSYFSDTELRKASTTFS